MTASIADLVAPYGRLITASEAPQWSEPMVEIEARFALHVDNLRRLTPRGTLPELQLAFIDEPSFNAFAIAPSAERGVVAVHLGAIVQLHDTFPRLLAHHDVCPELGDVTGAVTGHLPFLLIDDEVRSKRRGPRQQYAPVDPARRAFAHHCISDSLDFLLMHELAHLWRGHVARLTRRHGAVAYREYGSSTDLASEDEIRQALECDADMYAATLSLPQILIPAERDGSVAARILGWGFAVYALFGIMDQVSGRWPVRHHPHPTARMRYVHAASDVMLKKLGRDSERILEGALLAHDAWSAVGWTMSDVDHAAEFERMSHVLDTVYAEMQSQLATPFVKDKKDIDTSGL